LEPSREGNMFVGPTGKIESAFLKEDHATARLAYFF
jgi:hypothetical protein